MTPHAGRRLIAVACLIHGALLALAPARGYRSPTYNVLFHDVPLMSQQRWGLVFLTAGVAGLLMWPPWRTFVLAFVLTTWAAGLLAAVITGKATSWSAPIWPTVVAGIVVFYGARSHHGSDA